MTKEYYWRCYKCGLSPAPSDSMNSTRACADKHDIEEHKKRPTSVFGYKIVRKEIP